MNRIKTKLLLLFGTPVVLLCSCIQDDYSGSVNSSGKEIDVHVSLHMPASSPKTYAISEIDENLVQDIDVLAFKADATKASGWAFAYSAKGTSITDVTENNTSKAKKQFSVKLVKSFDEQTFVVLANVREQLEALGGIAKGADKDELLARLVYSNPGGWNANNDKSDDDPGKDFEPFPMWGEAKETLTDATTQISGIYMVRSIARLDVVLSQDVIDSNNFTLDKIYVYNSKKEGRIVPDPVNLENLVKVKSATEPPGSINNANPLVYDVPASMSTAFERTIYLFEAAGKAENQASQATCIVVGGTFGTDGATTYYRLDFLKKSDTDSYFRDVLRNHLYCINILSVSGSGYTDPGDAFNSKSLNMVAEIVNWDDGDMGNIIFDGQYVLSVSQDMFSFPREKKTDEEDDNVLYVYTDYAVDSGKSGWYVDRIVDAADDTKTVGWLRLSPDYGTADDKTKVILTFDENNSGAERRVVVWIAAGRLRFPVTVVQELMPSIKINIVNPVNESLIEELLFFSPVGVVPVPQSFKVNWVPQTADVSVLNSTLASSPFPVGTGLPDTGTITGGNGGTGTITYDVQPPAISEQDSLSNPFFERGTKIDFTIGNGMSYESKSIFVRQIFYNLVVDKVDSYLLDGSTYTLKVRSNTSWRIKSILNEASGRILSLAPGDNLAVGTMGGYNISSGDDLVFTVTNDRTFWGLLHITFESMESPKRFEDKTVTLMFALPKVKILGMGGNSIYGYSPTDNSSPNSAYQMLNSPNNFGLNAVVSTVYSQGFEMVNTGYNTTQTNQTIWNAINNEKPDIIAIGYDLYINATQAGYYRDFMKNGGVIILLCEGNSSSVQNFMRVVFGDDNITQTRIHSGGGGEVYSLADDVNDPILHGPFGDVGGKQWGEDASQTCMLTNLPNLADIHLYSNGEDLSELKSKDGITSFRYKNLVWFGDAGFLSSAPGSYIICPFKLDSDKRPITKTFGRGKHFEVYNSIIYANIITWAIGQVGTIY